MRAGTRLVSAMLMAVGCNGALDVDILAVGVNGDPVVSPGNPGSFEVTVENESDARIVWGMGSSLCQLSLFAVVDGHPLPIDWRGCTDDLVEQGLNPGESRTETFEWDGHIPDIGGNPFLPPEGEYAVYGAAGSTAQSDRIRVTVEH